MRSLGRLPGGVVLGLELALLAVGSAHAGGAIGWATAVQQFETEGISVGGLAVVISIMALGVVVGFGMHSFLPVVVAACLGGALMANAEQVATIFGGGAGGGSLHAVLSPSVSGTAGFGMHSFLLALVAAGLAAILGGSLRAVRAAAPLPRTFA